MRLGGGPMRVKDGSQLAHIYGMDGAGLVFERHRHRFEVNPEFVLLLEEAGLVFSGVTPGRDGHGEGLIEAVELTGHPFCIGLQSLSELRSRLLRHSPQLSSFVSAAL